MAPESFDAVLDDFAEYLRLERNRSAHTVRAYVTDVRSLLGHLRERDADAAIGALDLPVLRSWLARQSAGGAARTTMARRTSSARTFTAWLARTGRLPADPGTRLASARPHRALTHGERIRTDNLDA